VHEIGCAPGAAARAIATQHTPGRPRALDHSRRAIEDNPRRPALEVARDIVEPDWLLRRAVRDVAWDVPRDRRPAHPLGVDLAFQFDSVLKAWRTS